ncbi:single-stranded DNA-binding protein [Cellulomonas rhizosphaerae]|uniref:Single-stranded DNA-binding protein n=1 Tax=Cellulomonas rhizosphaerae TaxID=2293719 RepID=A0A413RQW9_9CELL|nr:single-stranded DNA-binding protein [Cellulomonas rhizosphaerae]RHA44320.1 single-stranded DNA-binding protein [Cellulomonas rhizosphaerae]
MSTQSLDVTVVGWIGSDVTLFPAREGRQAYTSFRVASTRRFFDRSTGAWRDGRTEWFRVKVWRTLAVNVAASLRKGDPIVAHGRLSTEEWVSADGTPRSGLVLEAVTVGHDLAFGSSNFRRTISARAEEGPTDVTGLAEAPDEDSPEITDGPSERFVPADAVADGSDDGDEDDSDLDELREPQQHDADWGARELTTSR